MKRRREMGDEPKGGKAMANRRAILLHPADTVAVLVEAANAGESIQLFGEGAGSLPPLTAREAIPYGHKVAVRRMEAGSPVVKYGETMGIATAEIAPGFHVHVHNVRGLESSERGGAQVADV